MDGLLVRVAVWPSTVSNVVSRDWPDVDPRRRDATTAGDAGVIGHVDRIRAPPGPARAHPCSRVCESLWPRRPAPVAGTDLSDGWSGVARCWTSLRRVGRCAVCLAARLVGRRRRRRRDLGYRHRVFVERREVRPDCQRPGRGRDRVPAARQGAVWPFVRRTLMLVDEFMPAYDISDGVATVVDADIAPP